MKLRGQMAIAGALVVVCTLGVIAPVLYRAESHILADQFDASLASTAQQATAAAGIEYTREAAGAPSKGGFPWTKPQVLGASLVQYSTAPTVGGGAPGFPAIDARDIAVFEGSAPSFTEDLVYRGVAYRVYTTRSAFIASPLAPRVAQLTSFALVRVARKLSDESAPLHRLGLLMAALVGGGAVGAMAFMAVLTGRILRPARRLTAAVEHVIATGDLSGDLGTGSERRRRDEIGRLAASFSAMMHVLDDSLQAQRRLVADASHELRTPLTSLTTNLDLLDEVSGSADPLGPELVRDARAQAYELRALVNDLVDLARFASVETHVEDTRLDLLAARIVERTRDLGPARTRGIGFELDARECLVLVDPDAVHRAITNLIDNAVKWSPQGGTIRVEVRRTGDGHAELGVRDEGPGVPPADLPFIFDRFYRSSAARALPGSGLGLAIVRQIAELNQGSVRAEPCTPGVRLVLRLPLSSHLPPEIL